MERFERSGSVAGRIIDRDTGQPLYGVTVAVEETDITTRTDIRGRFRIGNIPSGECILRCHLEGYRPVATAAMMIAPGRVTRCECELAARGTIPLNEPVILLPLRLEIRKHFPQSPQEISRYKVARVAANFPETTSRRFAPFETSSVFELLQPQKSEYWIRWYPDDIHYLTPVGKITDEERIAWELFWHVVEKHRALGSVKGLYAQKPYNLSIEVLEIFYGIRSGRLTDDEILRCNAYDELARQRIETEEQGVREVLDWQDMVNPEVKKAWIEFTKEFGTVRARQITRDMLEGNWDFDTDNEEDEPLDILINQGMPITTLPDEISVYAIKDGHIDPVAESISIDNRNLIAAPTDLEGTHWMTDFTKAVDAGMGKIIREEDKVKLIDQADWLIVVGVNDSKEARNVLEEIFLRNNASGEIGILAQDSPTNNTDTSSTQYTGAVPEAEEYLRRTRMSIPAEDIPTELSNQLTNNILDAHRLSYLFGVSDSTLSQMPASDSAEITEAGAMAALLWTSCTLLYKKTRGTQLRQYAHWGSQPLQFNIGDFFVQNVRSRGSFPILRIGENPYGILPVMSMRDWCKKQVLYSNTPDKPNEIICRFINILKNTFLELTDNAPKIDETADDIYETLLEILRSSPVSKRVDVRAFNSRKPDDILSEDAKYLNCPLVKDAVGGNVAGNALPFPEIAYLSELGHINHPDFDATSIQLDDSSPLLKRLIVYFLRQVFPKADFHQRFEIKGTVVDGSTGKPIPAAMVTFRGSDLSAQTNEQGEFSIFPVPGGSYDVEVMHPDYVEHLAVNVLVQSGQSNELSFFLEPTSNTENNATEEDFAGTLPLDESGKTIWGKVIDRESGAELEGVFVHLLGTGRSILTDSAGEYRFDSLPDGDHKMSVGVAGYDVSTFYVTLAPYTSESTVITLLASINTGARVTNIVGAGITIPGGLHLIADAANTLKRVNPDKLEILLLETLDLFSHRLDAWLTGFANARLVECLREIQKPPQIGIYGWLEKPGKLDVTPPKPEFIQAPSVKQATTAAILRNAAINNGEDGNSTAFQINLSSAQVRAGAWYLEGIRQGHLPGELLGYRLERLIREASNTTATDDNASITDGDTNQIKETDIYCLRKKYPLILHEDQINTNESTKLTIIDGEKFLNDEQSDSKFDDIKARLNQIKDAAADIAICEVVDADGDIARRGGWLDFLDGDGLPPAEEFIRSHRIGDVHGTKVFLQITPPDKLVADESITNPRIIADPILAHFCESLMPNFGSKEIVANLVNADKTKRPITFFARDLNIHPIDLVLGGVEELRLRIRYYLLSRWKANDLVDPSIPSPYNIFGTFPAHDMSDEALNDIGIEIATPTNPDDTSNFWTYVEKADSIRKLLHQNRSKDSGSTVSPDQLPIIADDQLEQLDLLAGMELLSNRLRRLQNQLVHLVSRTIAASSELKMRLIVLHGLRGFRQSVLTMKERLQNGTTVDDLFDRLEMKLINLTDSDHNLSDLVTNTEIPLQVEQLRNNQDASLELVESLLAKLADIEREFGAYIEDSAKLLVADANLPMLEISQFSLETALTVLPDEPTVTASVKIIKLFDRLIFDLTEKLSSMLSGDSGLKNYVHCLKTVYMYGAEINQILCQYVNDPTNALNQLTSRLPLTQDQAQLILVVQFQNMNYVEPVLDTLLDNIDAMNQKSTYYEDYFIVAKLILADTQGSIYDIIRNSASTAVANLMNTFNVTQEQAEIIASLAFEDMDVFDAARVQELIASTTRDKSGDIISLLQASTDKQGMVILTPYLLTGEYHHRPNWNLDYSKLVHLTGSTYLQEYVPVRIGISNLFDTFDVASQLRVYEDKRYQRIDPLEIDFKPEGNTDYLYLTGSSDPEVSVTCLTFLLIDQWQEGIPNPEQSEVTGIALRYDSPQAEAPNAVIIAVPPYKSDNEYWSVDLLANTLLETLELMQIRMVGSHDVADSVLGRLLPTLLFSPLDYKPLFPSKERWLYPDNISPAVGYTLATHMSRAALSRTKPPTVRNEAPDIGDDHVWSR